MKTIIAGSRGITEVVNGYPTNAFELLDSVVSKSEFIITEVVSGKARGVDTLGEAWASYHNIPVKQFPADWGKYGRGAGKVRNEEMANYADALIALRLSKSSGTTDMINRAINHNLKCFYVDVEWDLGLFIVQNIVERINE